MPSKILVLGKGFIGNAIFEKLSGGEDTVVCAHRSADIGIGPIYAGEKLYRRVDLSDADEVKLLYHFYQPDIVFHCASTASTRDNYAAVRQNLDITNNIVEFLPAKARLIFASSATVYSNRAFDEGASENSECSPASAYGITKLASESLLRMYYEQGKLSSLQIMRLCAVVGRGATHGFIPDLIAKLRNNSETLNLIGRTPGSIKPFIHVGDVVSCAIFLMSRSGCEVYNVANEDLLTVKQVAKLAQEITGIKKNIVFNEVSWAGDNNKVSLFNDKLRYTGLRFKYPTSNHAVTAAIQELS